MSKQNFKIFRILPFLVNKEITNYLVRLINIELFKYGISKQEITEWNRTGCWFPHLTLRQEFKELPTLIPDEFKTDIPAGPQIVVGFPELYTDKEQVWFHTDDTPDWAKSRNLKLFSIVGIALTKATKDNGGLRILSLGDKVVYPNLNAGDAIVLHPDTKHSRGVNITPFPRYMFYFRYLQNELS
jgi:hypothetical protein